MASSGVFFEAALIPVNPTRHFTGVTFEERRDGRKRKKGDKKRIAGYLTDAAVTSACAETLQGRWTG